MLHHSVVAGAPLTLGYWLMLRRWCRPAMFSATPPLSRRSWLVSSIVLVMVIMTAGVLLGGVSPIVCGVVTIIGLIALLVIWRVAG